MRLAGSRILITGGTGFLGRHLATDLIDRGAHVVAVGRAQYDLRRRCESERMLAESKPAAVVHLAAVVGGIGANRRNPGQFLYENAVMGVELIEACRVAKIAKVVVAGTVCAYPKFTPVPFSEDSLWDGYPEETNAPYGIAKRLLLTQGQAYREQYGLNVVHLIPVNLYGRYDNFDPETSHVIPGMILKFIAAREDGRSEVTLWGDGTPTREFLHVRDAARAFRLALEGYDDAAPVNIGSGQEVSIAGLAALIAEASRYRGEVVFDSTKPNGQPRRRLATGRAEERFGFEASIPLRDGLRDVIGWFESSRGQR